MRSRNLLSLLLIFAVFSLLLISCSGKKNKKTSAGTTIPSVVASDQTYLTKKQVAEMIAEKTRVVEDGIRNVQETNDKIDEIRKLLEQAKEKPSGSGSASGSSSGDKDGTDEKKPKDFRTSVSQACRQSTSAIEEAVSTGRF